MSNLIYILKLFLPLNQMIPETNDNAIILERQQFLLLSMYIKGDNEWSKAGTRTITGTGCWSGS